MLSIIIPTLNEEDNIAAAINNIKSAIYTDSYEIIIADGGSKDKTTSIARNICHRFIASPPGRGVQLNYGANNARGNILLFLHADTILPVHFDKIIAHMMTLNPERNWGRFDIKLSGGQAIFRIIEKLINFRSRLTSISTGDQSIFVSRKAFDLVGGFKDIPLMEDIDISRRLKKVSAPICINAPVVTSSRRWEEKGIIRTILLMWWLRFLFYLGIKPETLKHFYY